MAALEVSTPKGSVALRVDGETREAALEHRRAHASDLLPCLDSLLRAEGISARELDACVVGIGPGSFTGLRVAVATAYGLARASRMALAGVPSLEALAFDALAPGEEGVVIQDARAGAIYFARYAREPEELRVLVPPSVAAAHDFAADVLKGLGARVALIGDEQAFAASALPESERGRLVTGFHPRASTLLALGIERLEREGPMPPRAIEPLYLRPFEVRRRAR